MVRLLRLPGQQRRGATGTRAPLRKAADAASSISGSAGALFLFLFLFFASPHAVNVGTDALGARIGNAFSTTLHGSGLGLFNLASVCCLNLPATRKSAKRAHAVRRATLMCAITMHMRATKCAGQCRVSAARLRHGAAAGQRTPSRPRFVWTPTRARRVSKCTNVHRTSPPAARERHIQCRAAIATALHGAWQARRWLARESCGYAATLVVHVYT